MIEVVYITETGQLFIEGDIVFLLLAVAVIIGAAVGTVMWTMRADDGDL